MIETLRIMFEKDFVYQNDGLLTKATASFDMAITDVGPIILVF